MKNFNKIFKMAVCAFAFTIGAFASSNPWDNVYVAIKTENGIKYSSMVQWAAAELQEMNYGTLNYTPDSVKSGISKLYTIDPTEEGEARFAEFIPSLIRDNYSMSLQNIFETLQQINEVAKPAKIRQIMVMMTPTEEIEGMAQQAEETKKQLEDVREQLNKANELLDRARKATGCIMEISGLEQTRSSLYQELNDARSEKAVLETEKAKLEREIAEFRQSPDFVKSKESQEREMEMEAMKKKVAEMEQALAKAEKWKAAMMDEIKEMESERNRLQINAQMKAFDMEEMQTQMVKTEQEKAEMREELAKVKQEKAMMEAMVAEMRAEREEAIREETEKMKMEEKKRKEELEALFPGYESD